MIQRIVAALLLAGLTAAGLTVLSGDTAAQQKTSPIEVRDCRTLPGYVGAIGTKGEVLCSNAPLTAKLPIDCTPGSVGKVDSTGVASCVPAPPPSVTPKDCGPGVVGAINSDMTVGCTPIPATGADVSADNTWTGTQTFTSVLGSLGNGGLPVTGITYTFAATDCGKTVVFAPPGTVTTTVPQSIVPPVRSCNIGVLVLGNFRVTFNGTVVTPAIPINENGYTGTSGKNGSFNGLTLLTVLGAPTAVLLGSGS